jgi:hypothetical protein
MSGRLAGGNCALVVPGVDLANHSFTPNTAFAVSQDGTHFELTWDMEYGTTPGKRTEPAPPKPNEEVLICYGARMPNALLMLHYGFMDPSNPNEQLPMECVIPGARKIRSGSVARAGKFLADSGDQKAEWAARQMMTLADPVPENGDLEKDLAAVLAMRTASREKLAEYPTSAEEDDARLTNPSPETWTSRMELCVRYRLSRKRNIEAFVRFLDAVEASVEREEA